LIKLENSCIPVSISQIVQSAIRASENFPETKSLYGDIYNRYCNYGLLNKKIVLDRAVEITKPFIENICISDLPSTRNWKEIFDFSQSFNIDKYYSSENITEKTARLKAYFHSRRLIDSDSITELRAVLSDCVKEQGLTGNSNPDYGQLSFAGAIISKMNNIICNKLWEDK
jgi:hypothetical protein